MSLATLQKIRNCPPVSNLSSEHFHRSTVLRKVNDLCSANFLSERQLAEGLTYNDLCVYLFSVQMSRGYEDEHLILRVFLMFVNRQNVQGRFREVTYDHPDMDRVRLSESDLRVLLICTLYLFEPELLDGYVLYDKSLTKAKFFKLQQRKDFDKFYLVVRMLRQNLLISEKYKRHQEMEKSVFLYEMGIQAETKDKNAQRHLRSLP